MPSLLSDQPAVVDRLGFEHFAEILADVVRTTPPPFTIGVFGEWGSGKTTLMRFIRQRLDETGGVKTVWFNAWKYDGKEVIWNALIQTIFLEMRRDAKAKGDEDFLGRLHEAAANLALFAAKRFASKLTGGIVTADDIDGVRAALKPFTAEDKTFAFINGFEATFRNLVERHVGKDGRLVVFVDDLDRCLPENAVEALEAIKLYLDEANVTFVIGVEPAVVRDGIRHRYRDIAALQDKEYLEKIVQLPFVMRGVDPTAAARLLEPYVEAGVADFAHYEAMRKLIFLGTDSNPRRIKRFVNTLYVLRRMSEASGRKVDPKDLLRLSTVLLVQMRRPMVYDALVRDPGLVKDYNDAAGMALKDREERFGRKPALATIHDDPLAQSLFQELKDMPSGAAEMVEWVRLAQGAEA
jgi:hypothetical protein